MPVVDVEILKRLQENPESIRNVWEPFSPLDLTNAKELVDLHTRPCRRSVWTQSFANVG